MDAEKHPSDTEEVETLGSTEAFDVTDAIDSVTIARLLAEVHNGDVRQPTSYNRMHNRHNRS